MKEVSCDSCASIKCFIKNCGSNSLKEFISNKKRTSFYKEKQHIIFEGDKVLGLFFIMSGKIKVVSSGLYGKSQVVRLTQPGDIIGHRGYGGETYPIGAIALTDAKVCLVENDEIYKAFMDNPSLTFELMMYYSRELRKSEAKIKSQAQMNVREKVADALLYCDSIFNDVKQYPFQILLNRGDLADLAGINTEQLSRVLTAFKKDNMISILKNEISIIDSNALSSLVAPFGSTE